MTIRYRRPDRKNGVSLLQAARREMRYTLKLEVTDEAAPTIIRNVYTCFHMLGEALMAMRGKESFDHAETMRELLSLKAETKRPIAVVDNLRQLRHNINYYGYLPSKAEAEDARSIAESCFEPLHDAVMDEQDSQ